MRKVVDSWVGSSVLGFVFYITSYDINYMKKLIIKIKADIPNKSLDSYIDITKQELRELRRMSAKKSLELGILLSESLK